MLGGIFGRGRGGTMVLAGRAPGPGRALATTMAAGRDASSLEASIVRVTDG